MFVSSIKYSKEIKIQILYRFILLLLQIIHLSFIPVYGGLDGPPLGSLPSKGSILKFGLKRHLMENE